MLNPQPPNVKLGYYQFIVTSSGSLVPGDSQAASFNNLLVGGEIYNLSAIKVIQVQPFVWNENNKKVSCKGTTIPPTPVNCVLGV
jgi:hypothetical protein